MYNTREIATQVLASIYTNFDFFETALLQNKSFSRLDPRDKAFVRTLILNTLRRNGEIKKVINELVKRPLKKKDFFILNLIRISICQILFLNIKEYSIVNTAVQIAKSYQLDKFVNGLLRNVCRNKEKILEELSLKDNIPRWIKSDIIKNLGEDVLNEISKTIISEPFLDIKIKNNYLKKNNWEKVLDGKFILKDIVRIKNDGPIESKPFFNDGSWWVQSISSTLPVKLIEKIFSDRNKSKISILDVGAAPGGKTFQLIEEKFDVKSLDISERRIRRLKQNLQRLNFQTKVICKDFFEFKSQEYFDCILIDAPCTGSGLMQKKPEILIRNKERNLKKLVHKQSKMLEKSTSLLKTGGYIVYCVCSIHSNEGVKQIENFIRNNQNFKAIELNSNLSSFGTTLKEGMLLINPNNKRIEGGIDGFFISILEKIK